MAHKALLLGRNGDDSLCWCCRYDGAANDEHGLAHCDVRTMRDALKACRYEQIDVVGEDCRCEEDVSRVVKAAVRSCQNQDHFLFYFSGHARTIEGELELILAAGRPTEVYPSSNLFRLLQHECRARTKLLILDCCYADGVTNVWQPRDRDNLGILVATKSLVRGKEVEELRGGIFTHCLCQALTNPSHWRPDAPKPLVNAQGHICADLLLEWLTEHIQAVGAPYGQGLPFPEPTGHWARGQHFPVARVRLPPPVPPPTGWPPALLGALHESLRRLGVGAAVAEASYRYCRARADSDILPQLPPIESHAPALDLLTEPGRYYFAGNRLKLPLLTFVAHLSQALGHPDACARWLEDAQDWLVKRGGIAPAQVTEAAAVAGVPSRPAPQPYLMISVAPDLAAAPGSFSLSWDYLDEYGDPVSRGDPTPGLGTPDALIRGILSAVRALPGRTSCKPQIEVLLPFDLLSDDTFIDRLERAMYRDGERPPGERLALGDLAAGFPLVLRCWERWVDGFLVNDRGGTDARALWYANAACIDAAPGHPCLRWLKRTAGQPLQCAALLQLRPQPPERSALALACADPLPGGELAALLDLGVPILLWPRHRRPAPAALTALKQSLAAGQPGARLRTLPQALREHRARLAAQPRAAPCDVSLLWDVPDRVTLDQFAYDTSALDRGPP